MASDRDWEAFPYVLVRTAGIALGTLHAYRHSAALRLNRHACALHDRLLAEGQPLAARLYALTPRLDASDRRTALAAQRALYNAAALPDAAQVAKLSEIDAQIGQGLSAWRKLHALEAAARQARDRRFLLDASRRDAGLLEVCRAPLFERALQLANPALLDELSRIPPGAIRRRERQALSRAMRYLLRATLKPTPFSYFCTISAAPFAAPNVDCESGAAIGIDRRVADRVLATLSASPGLRGRRRIRLAPLAFADPEGCWAAEASGHYRAIDPELFERIGRLPSAGACESETGLAEPEIERALAQGIAEADWGVSEEHSDGVEILLRLLWEHWLTDARAFDLLPMVDALASAVAELGDCNQRKRGLAATQAAAAALGTGKATPPVFEDCWTAPPPLPDFAPFFDEITQYAGELIWPHPLPEQQALRAVFEKVAAGERQMPLLRFHRRYLALCRELGLGTEHWTNARALCRRLGVGASDPLPEFSARLAEAMRAAPSSLAAPWSTHAFAPAPSDRPLRLSLRFASAADGRHHPVFWGGEIMSLLPRYARIPFPGVDLAAHTREWMARWPDVVDLYGSLGRAVDLRPRVTMLCVETPNAPLSEGAIPMRDLVVRLDEDGRALALTTTAGRRVRPLFLGVTAMHGLPPIYEFLLHLGPRNASFLEFALRAVSEAVSARALAASGAPERLPSVTLGRRILLTGPSYVMAVAALPKVGATVTPDDFFRFHDWLMRNGLPRLAQAWTPGRLPLWIDFDHPLGVADLYRFVSGAKTVLLRPRLLGDAAISVAGGAETEYYVELAIGGGHLSKGDRVSPRA